VERIDSETPVIAAKLFGTILFKAFELKKSQIVTKDILFNRVIVEKKE
jgi:hypothetical protein